MEAAAEWQSDHYEVFGINRPADNTIALYPHCSRTKIAHIRNAIKWWAIIVTVFFSGVSALILIDGLRNFLILAKYATVGDGWWMTLGMIAFITIAVTSMTKQWMPLADIAQKVFSVLGIPHPQNIDLVKSSKNKLLPSDTNAFGSMYFRY